jgi:hypothetical protein
MRVIRVGRNLDSFWRDYRLTLFAPQRRWCPSDGSRGAGRTSWVLRDQLRRGRRHRLTRQDIVGRKKPRYLQDLDQDVHVARDIRLAKLGRVTGDQLLDAKYLVRLAQEQPRQEVFGSIFKILEVLQDVHLLRCKEVRVALQHRRQHLVDDAHVHRHPALHILFAASLFFGPMSGSPDSSTEQVDMDV